MNAFDQATLIADIQADRWRLVIESLHPGSSGSMKCVTVPMPLFDAIFLAASAPSEIVISLMPANWPKKLLGLTLHQHYAAFDARKLSVSPCRRQRRVPEDLWN